MRLAHQTDDNYIKTGTAQAQGTFKIKAHGKAFRILIDGLYSDKFQSIVRELCSNAFDSHKKLGNPAPFYVHLPTALRPEFYIRDYGAGMSHGKVMGTYSTLFDSDKDDDNDLVGMFGLGSKSPFAYTDQFCVTCYDGVSARHYAAGIGEGGVPQIMLLATEPCDEPLGVRVSISVNDKDFGEFKKAAERVVLGFTPEFECNIKLGQKLGAVLFKGDGWACYGGSDLPSQWNVRQGCVIYPVQATGGISLPNDGSYNGERKYLIEAPIGTIEVTTSREAVAYAPPVVSYIQDRLAALVKETGPLIAKKVKPIKNVAEFFDKIDAIKPRFVADTFTHALTGLTGRNVTLPKSGCIFELGYDEKTFRWNYGLRDTCTAQKNDPTRTAANSTVYEIADISRLLDLSRPETGEFSPKEYRRISRLLRAYIENKSDLRGIFWLGLDWSDEFVEAISPNITRIKITVDDLLSVIPKKCGKIVETALRGIAALKGASKDQVSVSTITNVEFRTAWMTADQFRRDGTAIQKFCNALGIDTIYIAASPYDRMEQSDVPRVHEAIHAILMKKYGVSWDDYSSIPDIAAKYSDALSQIVTFGSKLLKSAPKAYERLVRSNTAPGSVLRNARGFIKCGILPAQTTHLETFKVLNAGPQHTQRELSLSKEMKALQTAQKKLADEYNSPAVRFLSDINNASSKAQLEATTTALIAVFRAIPITMRWKEDY